MMISSDYTEISSFVSPDHGFTVFTTQIPKVWSAADHQCILWCNQLVKVLADAMFKIQDPKASTRTKPRAERMRILRNIFQSGIIDRKITLMPVATSFDTPPGPSISSLRLTESDSSTTFTITPEPNSDIFVFLTDCRIGIQYTLRACSKNECIDLEDSVLQIPSSKTGVEFFEHLKLDKKDAKWKSFGLDSIVLTTRGAWSSGFWSGQWTRDNVQIISATYMDMIIRGGKFNVSIKSLVSTILFSKIKTSLLKYRLRITRPSTAEVLFAPVLHHSISTSSEEKFWSSLSSEVELNFFGLESPYTHQLVKSRELTGFILRLFVDPAEEIITIEMEADLYGSMGHLVRTYKMVLLAFPFVVVLLVVKEQLDRWNRLGMLIFWGIAIKS